MNACLKARDSFPTPRNTGARREPLRKRLALILLVVQFLQTAPLPKEAAGGLARRSVGTLCPKKKISTRTIQIYKFKMFLLNFFDPCKSVLSVLSAVRFWFLCVVPAPRSRHRERFSQPCNE